MGIIESVGAFLAGVFAIIAADFVTVYEWIAARPWFIAVGCGLICLAVLAAGKLSQANDIIENQTGKEDEK